MIKPISINPKVTINCFFPITINPNVISSFLKPITILPKIYPKDWTPFPKAFYPNITSSLFFETLFNNFRSIGLVYNQPIPVCFNNKIIFAVCAEVQFKDIRDLQNFIRYRNSYTGLLIIQRPILAK